MPEPSLPVDEDVEPDLDIPDEPFEILRIVTAARACAVAVAVTTPLRELCRAPPPLPTLSVSDQMGKTTRLQMVLAVESNFAR